MSGSAQLSRDDSLNARRMALGSGLSAGFRRVPPGSAGTRGPAPHTSDAHTNDVYNNRLRICSLAPRM